MKWSARYISAGGAEDHKTIYADSVNEATKIAQRWEKKGFKLVSVRSEVV